MDALRRRRIGPDVDIAPDYASYPYLTPADSGHDGRVADDDLDRLLREVDASLSGSAPKPSGASSPAVRPSTTPASKGGGDVVPAGRFGSAVRTGGISAAVCGVGVFGATFFLQWLPVIDNPVSSGLGAALGAFLTGASLGFRRR
jgi:hypothetical protein